MEDVELTDEELDKIEDCLADLRRNYGTKRVKPFPLFKNSEGDTCLDIIVLPKVSIQFVEFKFRVFPPEQKESPIE